MAVADITPTSRRTPRGVLFRVPEKKKAKEEVVKVNSSF
jgi:hypothetical protein